LLPFFHTNGLCLGWPAAAVKGAALAIRRKFSATEFWDDVRRFNATSLIYVGELLRYLLNQPETPLDRSHPLKMVMGNGLRPELWKDFKIRFGIKKVYEFYGAAESMGAFRNLLNLDNTVGLCLQPHAFIRYDVDEELPVRGADGFMRRVDAGAAGLLIFKISKRHKFIGYTDRKATEKKILRDVFKKGDKWFNTGDLMKNVKYRHTRFVDRLGDSFRWKGENISPSEVEIVMNGFPGVDQAAVYGVKIPHADGRAGMASVMTDRGFLDIDFRDLVSFLKNELPSCAIPLFLRFKEHLDITSTAKVKKRHLRDEEFDLHRIKDPIYILLPDREEYEPLTEQIYAKIQEGKYKF
jgi:acyl-CoA synthetase (AMP-forming)/AMP-acid ligase II